MKKSRFWRFRAERRSCLNQAWSHGDTKCEEQPSSRQEIFGFGVQKSSGGTHRGITDYPTPRRNRQIVPPTDNEVRPSNLLAPADSENIPQPRRFEYSGRLSSFFRPAFPESIPAALAIRRRSFRTAFGAGNLWVCAKASPNCFGKPQGQTRGFTSCQTFG